MRSVKTQWGLGVIANINGEFAVFLPPRIGKLLEADQAQFDAMRAAATDKRLFIRYIGGKYNEFEWLYK